MNGNMKRYLLFAGNYFYPLGGWNDFVGDYDTIEEALQYAVKEWWHIVDSHTKSIIKMGI